MCHNCKDLAGIRFKKLVALEVVEKPKEVNTKNRGIYWKCICDCGNYKTALSTALISGATKSCGCLKHIGPFKGYGEIPKSVYTALKNWNAKSRDIDFEVSIEYLWDLFLRQDRKCVYTGEVLKFGRSKNDASKTASLDRIDSKKGYIEGNVVWCNKRVNVLKMDLNLEDFYKLCKSVNKYEKQSKAVISTIVERDTRI